ncbi:hypothetical protein [Aromatoleum anaerobium]|uniref:Uncharacterized protein n=1 Tax=Aromatoleum anaerobium TaxID=182180 RepID=A0ABX1PQH9_9RHOO|nr:hypothetical protein [Aromatoleum anaerobium]MCK0506601.1 hypothetical protein [Aromatoleum anaerobium]
MEALVEIEPERAAAMGALGSVDFSPSLPRLARSVVAKQHSKKEYRTRR